MWEGYLLTVAGLICFLEGLPYFAFPDRLKKWLLMMTDLPSARLRVIGGAMMLLGLLLVYWGRRYVGR